MVEFHMEYSGNISSETIYKVPPAQNVINQNEVETVSKEPRMKLIVNRKWQTHLSTISELSIEGVDKFGGFTLEPAGPDTIIPQQNKRIPEGEYKMKWYNAQDPKLAKYNPLPLLYNDEVSESRLILFHQGNYPQNTLGCLLVGTTRDTDMVNYSVKKLLELKEYLSSVDENNVRIIITSQYDQFPVET